MNNNTVYVKQTNKRNNAIDNDYLFFLDYKASENLNLKMAEKLDKLDGDIEIIPTVNNYKSLLKDYHGFYIILKDSKRSLLMLNDFEGF